MSNTTNAKTPALLLKKREQKEEVKQETTVGKWIP